MTPIRRVIDLLLEGALEVGKRLGRAPKLHQVANIIPSLFTSLAFPTGYSYFQGDTVSNLEAIHLRSYCADDSSRLMAQSQGLSNLNVAITEVLVIVYVRTAKSGGTNGNLELCWPGGFQDSIFLSVGKKSISERTVDHSVALQASNL